MNTSDPAVPESNSVQDRLHSRGRFWRWGIWFWVVAWIASMLVVVDFSANLKGITGIRMVVGSGSAGMSMNLDGGFYPNSIRIQGPEFVWSHPETFVNNPEELLGIFGHAAWHDFGDNRMPVLPVAGFLWLWLIGAWTDGFKKVRWPGSFGSRHMMVRFAILISLPLLILVSEHEMRAKKQSSKCILNIRNIQMAVRAHNGMNNINPGEKIDMPWDEIFGPKKFLPMEAMKCPGGPSYRLIKHPPHVGELAAECPNPEHQRRMKAIDTSDW